MTSEVIIDVQPKDISIALLEDKTLVEYQQEQRTASFSVGNIYVAKVKKLMPGLNACFVDVGAERVAFLHYLDLGSQFSSYEKYLKQVVSDKKKLYPIQKATIQPILKKDGSIANTLKVGQEVLVQIVKEPINTKGPRLTCELSFAGRYLVLMPFEDSVSVSTKIKKGEERSRLKQLIQSIKPKNFGVIVRTVAEGKRAAELDAELKILLNRLHADFYNERFNTRDVLQICRHEFFRKLLNGKVRTSEDLHRNMRLLRSRMDADRPCLLIEIAQSAPFDKLEGRWHYGKDRLEVALRNSFAGDKNGIHILPTIHSDGRILVLACPLHGVETEMTLEALTVMLTNYTAESIEHMKEFFGVELHIVEIRVLPALNSLCCDTDE